MPLQTDGIENVALRAIVDQVGIHGFALYRFSDDVDAGLVRRQPVRLAHALGLRRSDQGIIADNDSLTLLKHHSQPDLARFPPYSNKTLNWHTDGYYSVRGQEVRTFLLHCVHPAVTGGELTLLDPQLLLIAMHDHDSRLIDCLSAADAMTLPGNQDEQGHCRPDVTVPVIFAHEDQTLGMRFTTRTRNIRWKDEQTRTAAVKVMEIINSRPRYQVRLRLNRCEGIVSRNILHHRSHFSDAASNSPRQILRGRYLDTPDCIEL